MEYKNESVRKTGTTIKKTAAGTQKEKAKNKRTYKRYGAKQVKTQRFDKRTGKGEKKTKFTAVDQHHIEHPKNNDFVFDICIDNYMGALVV